MKLHLPKPLVHALIACFASSVVLAGTSFAESAESVTYTTHQDGPLNISGYSEVNFENIEYEPNGAAIYHSSGTTILSLNNSVLFSGNTATSSGDDPAFGGAIYNDLGSSFSLSENGDVSFCSNSAYIGGAIVNSATFMMNDNASVNFSKNTAEFLGTILNDKGSFIMRRNGDVTFSENSTTSGSGVIYNWGLGEFTLSENGNVTFCANSEAGEGVIHNEIGSTFTLQGNRDVSFIGNQSRAIYNGGDSSFILSDNEDVTFSENSGGAIYNFYNCTFSLSNNASITFSNNTSSHLLSNGGTFTLSGNGDVTFSANTATVSGGVIRNFRGTFTLSNNGNVLFEKNAEVVNGVYLLRSILSGNLNLSAPEGKSIIFRDSVNVVGVNLNQEGTGDIIFTGATTEADLREVKGGIDGTAEEILNSRTSEIATNAALYGGRLIVEEGAILKGQGITVMENANAAIRLNNGEIDESGYEIAISSGSGLEFEGVNTLTASAIRMEDGTTLSFVLGDSMEPLVNLNATLLTGSLSITLSGNMAGTHQLITLQSASQYDVSCWTQDKITVSGASFYDLVWDSGVLTYNPHDKFEININSDTIIADDSETSDQLASGETVKINGNGHSLTVKNEVQLVQMALKNGTVKLEGENNNVVSVSLTEDGTLVLTAGAGLKTGDIISMVASGKGELVISGDITLDEHGMKGKAGSMASVSNMNATTTGDAVFENVAFTDSLLDIGAGTTATFRNAVLGAGTRVTDAPATAKFENTLALLDSTNTEVVTESTTAEALRLYMSGDTTNAVTLDAGAALVDLTCTVFDTITLSGSDLYLDLTALAVTLGDADAFSLTFTNGTLAAIDTDNLHIFATLDGVNYLAGYTTQQGGMAEKVYFTTSASVPEPATATLSLLALAALAARRRRK